MYKLHKEHELWYIDNEETSLSRVMKTAAKAIKNFEKAGYEVVGVVFEKRYDIDDVYQTATITVDSSFKNWEIGDDE